MSDPLATVRRRVRLLNRTDRPWLLAVLERRRPSDAGCVLGTVLAAPFSTSGWLDVAAAPGRALYAVLVNHVFYDSLVVSAVVTTPRELPDRDELSLEAVVAGGGLRLGLAATPISSPSGAASAPGTRHSHEPRR